MRTPNPNSRSRREFGRFAGARFGDGGPPSRLEVGRNIELMWLTGATLFLTRTLKNVRTEMSLHIPGLQSKARERHPERHP
jgi:hypothetical protein